MNNSHVLIIQINVYSTISWHWFLPLSFIQTVLFIPLIRPPSNYPSSVDTISHLANAVRPKIPISRAASYSWRNWKARQRKLRNTETCRALYGERRWCFKLLCLTARCRRLFFSGELTVSRTLLLYDELFMKTRILKFHGFVIGLTSRKVRASHREDRRCEEITLNNCYIKYIIATAGIQLLYRMIIAINNIAA